LRPDLAFQPRGLTVRSRIVPGQDLPHRLLAAIYRATRLGHAGYADTGRLAAGPGGRNAFRDGRRDGREQFRGTVEGAAAAQDVCVRGSASDVKDATLWVHENGLDVGRTDVDPHQGGDRAGRRFGHASMMAQTSLGRSTVEHAARRFGRSLWFMVVAEALMLLTRTAAFRGVYETSTVLRAEFYDLSGLQRGV
jgi:hypothetical protein